MKLKVTLFFFVASLFATMAQAQITGLVFRDFNGNGIQDANEPLVPGVTIKAYDASDAEVATTTSTATATGVPARNYSLTPPAYPVRLEFQLNNATTTNCFFTGGVDYSALSGASFGTNVKFVTAAGNNNNFGVSYPGEYVTNTNPEILTSIYTNGNLATTLGGSGTRTNALKISYNSAATAQNDDPTTVITQVTRHADIGSVWGVAHSPQANRAFYSAVLRRHSGIGPNGTGAIYITDPSTTTGATLFANLDALGFPTRGTGAYPYAATTGLLPGGAAVVPFSGNIGTNAERGILNSTTAYSGAGTGDYYNNDAAAFAQVGKVGLGGLDISDDGRFLFVMNLFDSRLYRIRIVNPKTPGTPAVTAADITSYTLPDPGYTNGIARPWAVKYYRGKVLIGLTNDLSLETTLPGSSAIATGSENTVPKYTNAKGSIYTLDDPLGSGTAFTLVSDVALDYPRLGAAGEINSMADFEGTGTPVAGINIGAGATITSGANENHVFRFNKWSDDYRVFKQDNNVGNLKLAYPQAIISDIEFDIENNALVVGVLDRTGLQMGYRNFSPYDNGPDDGPLSSTQASGGNSEIAAGDVIHVPLTATCTIGAISPAGVNSAAEFYDGDEYRATQTGSFDGTASQHSEIASGGLTLVVGKNQVVTNAYDPASSVNSGGIKMLFNSGANAGDGPNSGVANTAGSEFGANVYDGTTRGVTNAKGVGMGDIEAIKELAPIEIGNRVWNDANGDGIQNPGEAGIAGVLLELVDDAGNPIDSDPILPGVQPTTVTTDANGNWFLTSRTGLDATGINYGVAFEPNTAYKVRLATTGLGNDWDPTLNGGQGGGRAASNLAGLQLTKTDIVGNGAPDFSDNDAMLVTAVPSIMFTTGPNGYTDYNLDMGFKGTASLGNKVWRDDDNDGIQDTNEPGVAGITVTLFRAGGPDGNPATTADNNVPFATTTTDASGTYLFDNLPPSTYEVQFTLPANYTFTTQTNSIDNTTLTGGATAANGSDASTAAANFGRTGNIVLSAGENNRDVDAGIVFNTPVKQSIGDKVWLDNGAGGGTAANGTQDGTEPGVAGVTVTLYNSAGVAVATTITDANGNYLFDDIATGTYTVGFTLPPGYNFTTSTGVLTGTTNSDANTTTGRTTNITVAAGDNIRYVDAGLVPQTATNASLGNFVWYDVDQDGIQDADEPGVGGVTVELLNSTGTVLRTTTTDALGQYQFNDLTPNTPYRVRFTLPTGYTFTTNNAGTDDYINSDAGRGAGSTATLAISQTVTLASGQNNPSIDAGIYQTGSNTAGKLGDKVFYDNNGNGIQDAGEAGVPGVTVRLYTNGPDGIPGNADDVLQATTVTDANGNYQFVNLANGNYNVGFVNLPNDYSFTTPNVGADDAIDSDVNPATGRTGTYTIDVSNAATRNIQTVDAGIVPGKPAGLGSLGNKVWYDLNDNGVQDAGELGVGGVTVQLYRDANGNGTIDAAEQTPIATTTTNSLGEYLFGGLAAGNYQVGFSGLPTGFTLSTKDVTAGGGNDTNDSDGNTLNTPVLGNPATIGKTYTDLVSLAQGEDKLTVDLGIVAPANRNTLGGTVWFDTDADGLQAGNPGRVAGVTVTLYDNAGNVVATTVTDANGDYLFTGIADGAYSVGFSNYPLGFAPTTKEATNTPAGGSDADRLSGRTATVTLGSANRNDRSLDAGLVSTKAGLGNRVWIDTNGNGTQDAGEVGVPGVTVTLFRPGFGPDGIAGNADDAQAVSTTVTDQNGNYLFTGLDAGGYEVAFSTIPGGYNFTTQNTPGDNGNDTNSDANPTTGRTATITLIAGELDLTVDAGLTRPTASVGNKVWQDLDGDNVQDAGEPGVPGVVVQLFDAGGNLIGTAITNGDGEYLITNVPAGNGYYVVFSNRPAGSTFVTQNAGADNTINSKPNPATGQTAPFNVAAGQYVSNIDAGINLPFTLALTITNFTATKQNNTSVLNFTVASVTVGSVYQIERSTDGINFTTIGSLNSGNSSYIFTDINPIGGAKNYYRIKEVGASRNVTYSEVRNVRFNNDIKIEVYPIPATSNINITLTDALVRKPLIISLLAADGKEVVRKQVTNSTGTESIDVSRLAEGGYILRIQSSNEIVENRKVIITRK